MFFESAGPAARAARLGLAACVVTMAMASWATAAHAGNVTVVNTTAKPVPVRDNDNPAQQSFATTLNPSSNASSTSQAGYTVPAGKRLVIEYYSAELTQYPAGGYGYLYLIVSTGGNQNYLKIIPPVASTVPVNQLTRLYADAGSQVIAQVSQSSGSSSGASVFLSGYFVNVP